MEYSIDIECYFINSSDAQGCKVVVVSDHSSLGNFTAMLIRHNESDTILSLDKSTYHIDCYHHVLAFDIEANGTISILATRGEMELNENLSRCRITKTGTLLAAYTLNLYHYRRAKIPNTARINEY